MLYDNVCDDCGHKWETVQRMAEEAVRDCPRCGQPKARRVITGGLGFRVSGAPMTLGSRADLNAAKLDKQGLLPASNRRKKTGPVPWWRSREDGRINYDVLKDPKGYVQTGRT